MNGLGAFNTPIHELPRASKRLRVDLRIKRDDLTCMPGGGSKARKIERILSSLKDDVDVLITNGGTQSNHARVTALVAAQRGRGCELILHGDPKELEHPTGNLLLMLLSGAKILVVEPDKIGPTIQARLHELRSAGRNPVVIPGGGHSIQGALGLVDAVYEVAAQCMKDDWVPDYIVHASGTGGTQAGIMAGVDAVGWTTEVIGISVARPADRGRPIIRELYVKLRDYLGLIGPEKPVHFKDEWVGSGYAVPLVDAPQLIYRICKEEGVPLDPTYSAKAMAGLIGLIERGHIPEGSRVLFWHTGGLMNLMACSLDWKSMS